MEVSTNTSQRILPPPPPPPVLTPASTEVQPAMQRRPTIRSIRPASSERLENASVICRNCSQAGHYKRNCPRVSCMSCGRRGHFKQDCPQEVAKRKRTEDDTPQEDDHRWSVCRNCGSSRHIQANCPVLSQSLECYQCHQRGHMMTTCPRTRCYNCGTYGHSSQICHSKTHCFHCSLSGHRSNECPMKNKGRVCYQCKEPGHEANQCPRGQLCRMCRQPGHVIAHCPEVTCSYCNEKGHTAGACTMVQCDHCGGGHISTDCRAAVCDSAFHAESGSCQDAGWGSSVSSGSDDSLDERADSTQPPTEVSVTQTAVHPYVPSGAPRTGQVAVVIDGPYFERCLLSRAHGRDQQHYERTAQALRYALELIGDIFGKSPVGYWFDTDPSAFVDFVEMAVPLAHRQKLFQECALRKRYLTDEMNADGVLPNVVAHLVGGMKRQKGYTRDGPGCVWVQTGVDVAMSTCLIQHFEEGQFEQVVLLCGDSDVYPAVHYCNFKRRHSASYVGKHPVRVCGTSSSISKVYGQHQDLSDFLPRILLDRQTHREHDVSTEFPTHIAFR